MFLYYAFIVITIFIAFVILFTCLYVIEYIWCVHIKSQVPFVGASRVQQKAVAKYINDNYPNTRNIVECGSGHGCLARYIARKTNTNVIGLENAPFCVFLSRFFSLFSRAKFQTINTDMFEYLDNTKNKFDIAIAYLNPTFTPLLQKYDKKIKVLISLNFEIPNLKPVRIVDLKRGFVLYNYKKYPHKLFIYEFK